MTYTSVTYANKTNDGKIGKKVANMHNACTKNVLNILEIEVHTWKLNVLVD